MAPQFLVDEIWSDGGVREQDDDCGKTLSANGPVWARLTVCCGSDLAVRAMALGSVKTGAGKRWSKAEAARFTAYRDFLPPPFNGRACGFSLSPTPGL